MADIYHPNIKGLCQEIAGMRESILRRCAAVGCDLDEERLPQARKITEGLIGEFLFGAEYAGALSALPSGGPAAAVHLE
jgi:hypothetical protein